MPNWKKVIVSGSSAHLNQVTASSGIQLSDDAILNIGDGNDLQLYHDGSNSYIKDNGTGNIFYRGGTQTFQNAAGTKTMATFNAANSVDLNYNNNTKFQTTNTGVSVTGDVLASGNVSGSSTSTGSFGHVVIDGTPILSNDGNKIGIGSTHPANKISDWSVTSTITVLNVQDEADGQGARVAIQGADASLDLIDKGATGNQSWFSIYNQAQMVYLRSLNNNALAVAQDFITMDLSNGRVGIGSSNAPSYDLDVSGTGRFTGALTLGGNISGSSTSHLTMAQVSSSGDVVADGDVVAYNSSDRNLKDNIQVIKGSLDKIGEIRGVEFDWNEKSPGWAKERGHDVGVIAQEVQKVVPEIVVERKNGYLGVDYKRLVPLLIESIKELKEEVEILKKKVN